MKKISILGLGYIGLPTAAVLAANGSRVLGCDVLTSVVEAVNSCQVHIAEPGLEKVIQEVVASKRLSAHTELQVADVYIIAVPTPFYEETKRPNIDFVIKSICAIAKLLKPGDLIVLESTSPVGTTETLEQRLLELRPDLSFPTLNPGNADVRIAYCPERVIPGNTLVELVENDRIIGGISKQCATEAKKVYETFTQGQCFVTDARTAELAKLSENSYRDVNLAFVNQLSMLCDEAGVNVYELIKLCNNHPRVNMLSPGPGVGGHCIAVDPWFLISGFPDSSELLKVARTTNDQKPQFVFEKIIKQLKDLSTLHNIPVICYGLAFKADIDDFRNSPALDIAQKLHTLLGDNMIVVEPNPISKELSNLPLLSYSEATKRHGLHVKLVAHKEFKNLQTLIVKENYLSFVDDL